MPIVFKFSVVLIRMQVLFEGRSLLRIYGILTHMLENRGYNKFCNITWKNRADELEEYFCQIEKTFIDLFCNFLKKSGDRKGPMNL